MNIAVRNTDSTILLIDNTPELARNFTKLLALSGYHQVITADNFSDGQRKLIAYVPDLCILDIRNTKQRKRSILFVQEIRRTFPTVAFLFVYHNDEEGIYELCQHLQPIYFIHDKPNAFTLRHTVDTALMNSQYEAKQSSTQANRHKIGTDNYFFKIGDAYKKIPLEKISYFFTEKGKHFARVGKRKIELHVDLKRLTLDLKDDFERIHKKYLININRIERIRIKEDIIMIDGEQLPIGYAYKKTLLHRIPLLR